MEYNYKTVTKNGTRYGFVIEKGQVVVYVNDERWGIPQGSMFMMSLLNDIEKLKDKIEELSNM